MNAVTGPAGHMTHRVHGMSLPAAGEGARLMRLP